MTKRTMRMVRSTPGMVKTFRYRRIEIKELERVLSFSDSSTPISIHKRVRCSEAEGENTAIT